jgi:putative nucleotidyltransferase with HDIG domain
VGAALKRIRLHAGRWVWVLGLAGLTVAAFPRGGADVAPFLEAGDVAQRDVIAPFGFVVNKSDEEVAREAEALARSARPIYELEAGATDSATAAVQSFFAAVGVAAGRGPDVLRDVARAHGVDLTAPEADYLARASRRDPVAAALTALVENTLAEGVAAPGVLQAEQSPEVILRRRGAETAMRREAVPTYEQYLQQARARHPDRSSSLGDAVYLKLVGHFFRPTLRFNQAETERRRDDLRHTVNRSKYVVRAGDRIVAAHGIVTREQEERLVALHQELLRRGAATSRSLGGVLGPLVQDALLFGIFWVLLLFYRRETYAEMRQVGVIAALFGVVVVGAAAVARALPGHPELIPLPFAAVMLTVLFNGRVSMIAALILSFVIGVQPVFHDTPALFICAVGGVTAALSVRALRRRTQLYVAVVVVGVGYLVGSLVLGLAGDWSLATVGGQAMLGVVNGIVSTALALWLLPVAESVTRITTDLTLLELSDQSHPLLRRLSLEAPGTYAHSIAMANLVEAACARVGANGLLGRVGCYFHDVGKLGNPQFFVENQTRANPHDRLPAHRSAEIIKAHVTEGIRLAEEARLPTVVRAFIPEHHGTTDITYFLDRARRQGDTGARGGAYRYPGPRPRSVETAITMLADSVEASLRVLDDLTPARIEEAIEHIIRAKLASGQLDEAPITLQQIELVKEEFLRMLTGMYHGRIDYPESGGGISSSWQAERPARPSAGL